MGTRTAGASFTSVAMTISARSPAGTRYPAGSVAVTTCVPLPLSSRQPTATAGSLHAADTIFIALRSTRRSTHDRITAASGGASRLIAVGLNSTAGTPAPPSAGAVLAPAAQASGYGWP